MEERNKDTARERLLRYLWRLARLILAVAIYALVLWYGAETAPELDVPPEIAKVAIALIALGIAGSIYRIVIEVAKEAKGGIMVLADFLNENLVKPQRRRLIERGRAEGRAEAVAKMRSILIEEGVDPDLISRLDEETDDDARDGSDN